jgi:hypothetical protein
MSTINVGYIEGPSTASNKIYIKSGSVLDITNSPDGAAAIDLAVSAGDISTGTLSSARLAAGTVVQVVSTTKSDASTFSSANTDTYVDISGVTVTITPTSATNKILVLYQINVSQTTTATIHARLMRDSSAIGIGDQVGSNRLRDSVSVRDSSGPPYVYAIYNLTGNYLDSPGTTSATVYKMQGTLGVSYSGTYLINKSINDADDDYSARPVCTITVMEIKA